MGKVKLIVHETYQGKCKTEDIFAAVFLSNAAALTEVSFSKLFGGVFVSLFGDKFRF